MALNAAVKVVVEKIRARCHYHAAAVKAVR